MKYWSRIRKIFRENNFYSNISGNLAVMTALTMPVALVLAAVGIDEASLYTEKREAQSLVDIAAIIAAANLSKAETAVTTTFRDNGVANVVVGSAGTQPPAGANGIKPTVTITPGRYVADASAAVGTRFSAGVLPYNAVKVTFKKTGTRYFGGALIAPPTIATQAIASITPQAAFSIGSRLASVDEGILNSLLGGLTGSNLSLKVMDYNALISADVSALSFMDALATKLQITAGTYTNVLDASATIGQIVSAMASIDGISAQAKLALQTIASKATNQTKIPLSHLFDLGPVGKLTLGSKPAGLTANTSLMDILTASAALANGSNQVAVDLGINVLGLLKVTAVLAIGEPPQSTPWFTIGNTGTIVRTAQTRLFLEVYVGLKNVLPIISLLDVKLPIYVEVAYGEAKLTSISCPTGRPESIKVGVAARPGIIDVRIADINKNTFRNNPVPSERVEIANVLGGVASVTAKLAITSSNLAYTNLEFSQTDITNRTYKTVNTKNITTSVITSLLGTKDALQVKILGLDLLGLSNILLPAISVALVPITQPVDTLLYNVLGALGIRVGEADIRVNGATCGQSVLVQ
jgi:uncharacterized membrane protein